MGAADRALGASWSASARCLFVITTAGAKAFPANMFVPVGRFCADPRRADRNRHRRGAQRPWLGITTFEDEDGVNVGRLSRMAPATGPGWSAVTSLPPSGHRRRTLAEFYRAWARAAKQASACR